ncbi:MAG: single-stranded DNA-binding protein [Clostridia bacterium]|nr:single-stranded DNA-binding protein [Clostridia bacterium]
MLNCAEDNEARIVGYVASDIEFSHEVHTEGFYRFIIMSDRLSDNKDTIIVTVSERILSDVELSVGTKVEVLGQFRSYNNYSGEGSKLVLTLFARDLRIADESEKCENEIYLNGYICKPAVYRVTPFGREIADVLTAVNRAYNKSDYIPCIAWGRNAKFVNTLPVGTNIRIWGRMQSREYQKRISEDETVTKTAYEVSVSKLEAVKDEI